MRFIYLATLIAFILSAAPALADVAGGDFDSQPPGVLPPSTSPRVLGGDATRVVVVPAGSEVGAPTIPQGSGNVLCLDNRGSTSDLIIEFDFACDEMPTNFCVIKYDYTGAAWSFGGGFDVHVDANGSYNNPIDLYRPPVGFPPSTVQGSKSRVVGPCDASQHTLTFRVFPDGVLYLDNLTTECQDPASPTEAQTWGHIKSLYR